MTKSSTDSYSEAETVRRRESALKQMLATPHKPHSASHKSRKKKRVVRAKKERKS